jgi:hypothetical protein
MKTFAISSSVVSAVGGEPVHIMRSTAFSDTEGLTTGGGVAARQSEHLVPRCK